MGIVHAKESPQNLRQNQSRNDHFSSKAKNNAKGSEENAGKINVVEVSARVDRVFVDGLLRTKDDIVISTIKDVFQAKDFAEVLLYSKMVRKKLEYLGCFKNVDIYIDTSSGPKATPNGLDVTFYVKELKRYSGSITTAFGNNLEGNLALNVKTPNLFGRGERIQTEFSYGLRKANNMNIAFVKPFFKHNTTFMSKLFQSGSEWPWSGYRLIDRGVLLDLSVANSSYVNHNFQWEGVIQDVSVLNRTTSFAIREQTGPKLKSALRYILNIDLRDHKLFPSYGSLFQLTTEFAGLGGDIGFLKHLLAFQTNRTIVKDVVFQTSFQCGFLKGLSDKVIGLPDMFYLGGPLTIRGFKMRGIGPHCGENATGSNMFWAGAFHLYTPLPFRPRSGGFGELFRTHLFVNFGNAGNMSKMEKDPLQNLHQLLENCRLAYGLGIALRLGEAALIELNYCVPLWVRSGDLTAPGVQFGLGIQFL